MAQSKLLQLTIARVDQPVFSGEVVSVNVPGVDGEMTILAGHEPFITPLKTGDIRVEKSDGQTESFSLTDGVLEISHNHATILI